MIIIDFNYTIKCLHNFLLLLHLHQLLHLFYENCNNYFTRYLLLLRHNNTLHRFILVSHDDDETTNQLHRKQLPTLVQFLLLPYLFSSSFLQFFPINGRLRMSVAHSSPSDYGIGLGHNISTLQILLWSCDSDVHDDDGENWSASS